MAINIPTTQELKDQALSIFEQSLNQVAPLNEGFTPTAQEVAEAGKLLEAYRAAVAGGTASIRQGDRIIDAGTALQAQVLIDRAAACEAHDKAKVDALAGRPVPAP